MDIFSKIAAGEIPSYKCAADDRFYAFLDINPIVKGHTLVIPRREVDYIFDMDDEEIAAFQVFAKKVAVAIKRAFPCIKVGEAVLGLEVPHASAPSSRSSDHGAAGTRATGPLHGGTKTR